MVLKEFAEYIEQHILTGWMEDAQASVEAVRKNNGAFYQGLYIRRSKEPATPMVYLDDYYHMYRMGRPMEDILEQIREEYQWAMERVEECLFDLSHYEYIRDRIIYRLVNFEKNRDMLMECPHIRLYDLAITFRWVAYQDSVGISSALITNEEIGLWNITLHELLLSAERNTRRLFPEKIAGMEDFIEENGGKIVERDCDYPMYIITNEQQINGASVILYEGVLQEFAMANEEDYYILPSSIHEMILIPAHEITDPPALFDMVREVNNTIVAKDDILSDSVYFYDYRQEKLVPLRRKRTDA